MRGGVPAGGVRGVTRTSRPGHTTPVICRGRMLALTGSLRERFGGRALGIPLLNRIRHDYARALADVKRRLLHFFEPVFDELDFLEIPTELPTAEVECTANLQCT